MKIKTLNPLPEQEHEVFDRTMAEEISFESNPSDVPEKKHFVGENDAEYVSFGDGEPFEASAHSTQRVVEHVKHAANLEFDVVNGDYQGALDAALKEHPEIGSKYNNHFGREPHIKGYSEREAGSIEYEADSHEKDSVDAATDDRNTWDNIKEEMSHYSMDALKAHTEEYKDYLDYRSAQIRTEKGVESTPVNNFVSRIQADMEAVQKNAKGLLKDGLFYDFDDRGHYNRQTGEYKNTPNIDWGTDDYAMSRGANPTELGVASIRETDSQFANRELPCVEETEVDTGLQLDL